MSNEMMSLNPSVGAEEAYSREQLLADADHRRLVRTAKAATAGRAEPAKAATVARAGRATHAARGDRPRPSRLLDRFLKPLRRIVAARQAPVRQAGPTPLWR